MPTQRFVIHLFDWLFLLKGQGTTMLFIFWNWLFCSKAKSLICYSAASLFGMHPLVPQKPSLTIWPNWPENWNRIKLDLRETQKLKQNLLWHRLQNVKWEIQNILTKTWNPPLKVIKESVISCFWSPESEPRRSISWLPRKWVVTKVMISSFLAISDRLMVWWMVIIWNIDESDPRWRWTQVSSFELYLCCLRSFTSL